jgi:hypothetical protein
MSHTRRAVKKAYIRAEVMPTHRPDATRSIGLSEPDDPLFSSLSHLSAALAGHKGEPRGPGGGQG